MDTPNISEVITRLKSNDVDSKIDAIQKLQQAIEAGSELTDGDSLINALKTCLKHPNHHLTTPTLNALPSFFRLVTTGSPNESVSGTVDSVLLRQILTAFLPAGGLIDRLGDSRERIRESAREAMVVLGGIAFRTGTSSLQVSFRQKDTGKGPETPYMVWERFFKESGLQNKSAKVREQAILVLVHIRRIHSSFPLRPYLASLVDALEDTDGSVRDCARQSVVELFTSPHVSDAARADLKREMAKKGVRRTILESVQSQLASSTSGGSQLSGIGSDGGSENGDANSAAPPAKKQYIPPSMMLKRSMTAASGGGTSGGSGIARTFSQGTVNTLAESSSSRPDSRMAGELPPTPSESSEVHPVYIASAKDLENEFQQMLKYFEGRETEHNWAPRERSINRIRGMLKGEAHSRYPDVFIAGLKSVLDGTLKTLASLRTTVALCTCSLYTELAVNLQSGLDPFCETLLTNLLRMASLTKKIVANQSQATVSSILANTSPSPKVVINLLWQSVQDKNVSARSYAIGHLKAYLEGHGQRLKHVIEASGSLELLEKCVKKLLGDANAAVREQARVMFWVFEDVWKDRGALILDALDNPSRKALEKVCPNPDLKRVAPTSPPVKKSSVAAAIAASRAKAKAIAAAPPTLRHQAASTSQILHSSTSQRPFSPSASSSRPLSPSTPSKTVITRRTPSTSSVSLARAASPSTPMRRVVSMAPRTVGISTSMPMHSRSLSTESGPGSAPSSPSPKRRQASYSLSPPASPVRSIDVAVKTTLPPSPPPPRAMSPGSRVASPTRIPSPTSRMFGTGTMRRSLTGAVTLANQRPAALPLAKMSTTGYEESLLLAQMIPLPDESDEDDDESNHMLSFSAPYERFHARIRTATSSNSANSPPLSAPQPIVEDALRARAEQAESAAERLLELVEPEDPNHVSPIPPSLLPSASSNGSASSLSSAITANSIRATKSASAIGTSPLIAKVKILPPETPANKRTAVLKQAALFKDSPAHKKGPSLLDVLSERRHETGWWLKRMSLIDKGSPLKEPNGPSQDAELESCIEALEKGTSDVSILKKLALLSREYPVGDDDLSLSGLSSSFPASPTPKGKMPRLGLGESTIWTENKRFERLFSALMEFLSVEKTEEELEYALIVLWELLENQSSYMEGRESDVFMQLLRVRYSNKINILEATNTIRDSLVMQVEPVYGLTTLHASLRAFLADDAPDPSLASVKSASYAFGLVALGKFILRLPAEILEEELPRLKATLTSALSEPTSLVVRESAAACIVASQVVLRDETHLFTLLDGLPDEKKNLLTYLFDKHGARGNGGSRNGADVLSGSGSDKLEKELRRLDGRTNTPPRTT